MYWFPERVLSVHEMNLSLELAIVLYAIIHGTDDWMDLAVSCSRAMTDEE